MKLSHTRCATAAVFDDPNLVSVAGLVSVLALAQRAGLADLAGVHVLSLIHISEPTRPY